MNTPVPGLPLTALPGKLKNRRVLLLDTSANKRDLRADTMRKLGMEVDCAADISEARSWWRADLYSLVLIDMESELGQREKFCADMRSANPPQAISFLVGKPGYLAASPKADGTLFTEPSKDQIPWGDVRAALGADLGEGLQRWGILEASRRISAVRSLSHARSKATQDKPVTPRDVETRELKRIAAESRTLDDLLREEMQ